MLVVDVIVLSADRTLCALLELVLAVSAEGESGMSGGFGKGEPYVLTSPALSSTVTNLESSFS